MSIGTEADTVSNVPATPDRQLELLFRRYHGWLSSKLRFHYGVGLEEDLLQETYIRLAPYQDGREIRHPRALLWKIAQNLARNEHRRLRGRREVGEPWEENVDYGLVQAASQFESVLLQEIVLKLPFPLRRVLILSRFSGMTNEDIAKHCDVSLATVERRLAKALTLCTQHLKG